MNKFHHAMTIGEMREAYANSDSFFLCDFVLEMMGMGLERINDDGERKHTVDVVDVFCDNFPEYFDSNPPYDGAIIEWYIRDGMFQLPFNESTRGIRAILLETLCERYGPDVELTFTICEV